MPLLLLDATPHHLRFFGVIVVCDNRALTFAQTTAASDTPQYSVGLLTDYSVAVPGPNAVLRLRRGQRYNVPDSSLPDLGEQSDDGLVGLSSSHWSPQVKHICRTTSEIPIRSSTSPCRRHVQFHLRIVTFNQAIASSLNVMAAQFACCRAKCSSARSEIFLCLLLANDICYFSSMTQAPKTFTSLRGINWTASIPIVLMSTPILTGTTLN